MRAAAPRRCVHHRGDRRPGRGARGTSMAFVLLYCDEVNELVDGFDAMLDPIGHRTQQL